MKPETNARFRCFFRLRVLCGKELSDTVKFCFSAYPDSSWHIGTGRVHDIMCCKIEHRHLTLIGNLVYAPLGHDDLQLLILPKFFHDFSFPSDCVIQFLSIYQTNRICDIVYRPLGHN